MIRSYVWLPYIHTIYCIICNYIWYTFICIYVLNKWTCLFLFLSFSSLSIHCEIIWNAKQVFKKSNSSRITMWLVGCFCVELLGSHEEIIPFVLYFLKFYVCPFHIHLSQASYISYTFLFCILDALEFVALLTGARLPIPGWSKSQFLETTKDLARSMSSIHRPTHCRLTSPTYFLISVSHTKPIFLLL